MLSTIYGQVTIYLFSKLPALFRIILGDVIVIPLVAGAQSLKKKMICWAFNDINYQVLLFTRLVYGLFPDQNIQIGSSAI